MFRLKLLILTALVLLLAVPAGPAFAQAELTGDGTAVIWDDQFLSDAITYSMTGVSPPSAGTDYVGWLVSDDGTVKLSTGVMTVDEGVIAHTFDRNNSRYTGENLIHNYDRAVITEEEAATDPDAPLGPAVFAHVIPSGAMAHIRHLLSDWPGGSGVGILTNLKLQLGVAITHANLANNSDNIAGVKQHVEHVINAIEGPTGPNYGDINADGAVEDFGDGLGVLFHAADRKHAGFAAGAAPGDTAVNDNAALVDINGANAADFATLAVDSALANVLPQSDTAIAKLMLANVIGLLDNAMNGLDADASGTIDSVTGEGGASQAYTEAQRMATYTLTAEAAPPPPPQVGDTAVPLLAQIALIAAALLLAAGGLLLYTGRRSRARA